MSVSEGLANLILANEPFWGGEAEVSPDHLFRIYSMSKPIVSVATLMLVEQGKLALQDPVSDYIPEYANLTVMNEDGSTQAAVNTMTIEHLLTHESGLIYGVFDPDSELGKM